MGMYVCTSMYEHQSCSASAYGKKIILSATGFDRDDDDDSAFLIMLMVMWWYAGGT